MRLAIVGSRTAGPDLAQLLRQEVAKLGTTPTLIVSGGATSTDNTPTHRGQRIMTILNVGQYASEELMTCLLKAAYKNATSDFRPLEASANHVILDAQRTALGPRPADWAPELPEAWRQWLMGFNHSVRSEFQQSALDHMWLTYSVAMNTLTCSALVGRLSRTVPNTYSRDEVIE
jgi:hypothetical protein